MKRHRAWFWVVLFIFAVLLLVALATSWNVVLFRHYVAMLEATRKFSFSDIPAPFRGVPWLSITLGTLGFSAAMTATVLFFVRLLREMRVTQLQSEFLARVTHELKTPIATMELTTSLLRKRLSQDPESEKLWQLHDKEMKRLRSDVEALLEAARWENALPKLNLKPFVLEPWLSESIEHWKQILGPDAKLERRGDLLTGEVLVDEGLLNLAVNNLVENVRKFAKDTPRLTVETKLLAPEKKGQPPRWQLSFHDEGWGFPPQFSTRIFNRFFRARTGAPYAIPGTGLGLYLAASACRAQKLKLRAESEGKERGATFTLEGNVLEDRCLLA